LHIKERGRTVTEKAKNLQLEQFGFGPNVMKKTKVCRNCGRIANARALHCAQCGTRLPLTTLFDSYKQRHRCCGHCNTVLSADAKYCPHCGRAIHTAEKMAE